MNGELFRTNREKRSDLPQVHQSEEKLIEKQRQILEWASQRARITWLDKMKIARQISRNLFDLIDRSGRDLADMIVRKSRVDYETFLNSHIMTNASQLERMRINVEKVLTKASDESELKATEMKSQVIKTLIESIQKIEESIPKDAKYREYAIKTIESLVENAINRIESSSISINTEKLFSFSQGK